MQPIYYFCVVNNIIGESLHTKHMGSFPTQNIIFDTT